MAWRIRLAFISIFLLASLFHHLFMGGGDDGGFLLPHSQLATHKPQEPNLIIREQEEGPGDALHLCATQPLSVLFQDWEVFLLLPTAPDPAALPYSCLFQDGSHSPATPSGVLPSGKRSTYKCVMPTSVRRFRPFFTPHLTQSPENQTHNGANSTEILRWNFFVYESLSTETDVILFAKGINSRQGVNVPASSLRCLFADGITTPVTSSSQEVFRCPHPGRRVPSATGVSLEIRSMDGTEKKAIPSVAVYEPERRTLAAGRGKALVCACTVVYNVAKFLKEWVIYHSAIGVEKFVLYDNGSDDNFFKVVGHLLELGYDITTVHWPWPKTQESAFSHSATWLRDSCTWTMYADVDEFVFSPRWLNSSQPLKHMLPSLLPQAPSPPLIGQISIRCLEFGPSNRRSHPIEGVTQGYTCRRRGEQRHKSILRMDCLDSSLDNVVHHFKMKKGYRTRWVPLKEGVVNHYKYQAWSEFKHKFKRRVSAYVFDWRKSTNLNSKDRAPGLGNTAIEPRGWHTKFCDVNDTRLRDVTRNWFGSGASTGSGWRLAWQDQ